MSLRRSPSSFLALFGTATLVAGTLAGINAGCLTDLNNCTILLSRNTPGGTLGFLTAPSGPRSGGVSTFSITSTNAAETSTVNWMAIPKNVGLASSTTFVNNASLRRGPSGLAVQKGRTTLVAGTKTVTGVPFSAGALVFAMAATFGGTSGKLSVPSATVDATTGQFVINSDQAADTSTIDWVVISRILRFSPSGHLFAQSRATMTAGSVAFSRMNPLNESDTTVIASVIDSATPGNLACAAASRDTAGNITVTSSAAETSQIEVALF